MSWQEDPCLMSECEEALFRADNVYCVAHAERQGGYFNQAAIDAAVAELRNLSRAERVKVIRHFTTGCITP